MLFPYTKMRNTVLSPSTEDMLILPSFTNKSTTGINCSGQLSPFRISCQALHCCVKSKHWTKRHCPQLLIHFISVAPWYFSYWNIPWPIWKVWDTLTIFHVVNFNIAIFNEIKEQDSTSKYLVWYICDIFSALVPDSRWTNILLLKT